MKLVTSPSSDPSAIAAQRRRALLTVMTLYVASLAVGCSATPDAERVHVDTAAEVITAEGLLADIATLASDEFEGRAPGSRGEDLTVEFLTERFRAMGLEPGNPDGTYTQAVPLVGFTPRPDATFRIGGQTQRPAFPDGYVARSRRFEPEVALRDSELVFVGYGVVAPEYGWDDYKGADVNGKTVLMLVNDPPVPDPADPSRLDENVFRGEAMTYYGRWTYKYEIGAEKGTDAVIVIHETGPAGYPFDVISGSFDAENFDVPAEDPTERLAVEAWVNEATARELFAAAGHDFDELKAAAARRDFEPVTLDGAVDWTVRSEFREVESRNVIAKLTGSDPALREEYVIYTAHWDHFGMDEDGNVFNGALDNASGTAGVLQAAEAFAALPEPPARSVLFLAVTAEERGLLGSKFYAENPLYPLERTLAAINLDVMNPFGRTRDIEVIGYGNSSLDRLVEEEADRQGRFVRPDTEPERGYFFRSDHFEFAKMGVPALYTKGGVEYLGRPDGWGAARWADWTENDYHGHSDTVRDDWDLTGMALDTQLLFAVGYRVADGEEWPEWEPTSEFRSVREAMLMEPVTP